MTVNTLRGIPRFILVTVVLAAAAAGGAAVATSGSSDESAAPPETDPSLLQVSNAGEAIALTPEMEDVLARVGGSGGAAVLLGQRGTARFYVFRGTSQGDCYGIGPGDGAATATLGLLACGTEFPGSEPVLDLSVVETLKATGTTQFVNIRGLASDGVASITGLDATGEVAAKLNVDANLYSMSESELAGADVVRLIASDRDGHITWTKDAPEPKP